MTIKRAKVTSSRVTRSLGVPEYDVTLRRAGVIVPKSMIVHACLNFSTWTSLGYAQVKCRPQHVMAVFTRANSQVVPLVPTHRRAQTECEVPSIDR